MTRSSASSRACRPVALPALLLLLLLLFLNPLSACTASGDDASAGWRRRPARRLLVSLPSTHGAEQWMWVGGDRRPFRNDAGASLGRRRIPPRHWNPVHN